MKKGTKAFLLNVALMTGISGSIFLFFYFFVEGQYPKYFLLNPILYMIMSVPLCLLLNNYSDGKISAPSMKKLMLLRLIKVVGCLCIFLVGLLFDKTNIISFSIVFVIFYVAYLFIESRLMMAFNKQQRNNEK